jgi:hypothetical protein
MKSEKTTYTLASNPMVYTPGVVSWVRHLRRSDVKGARSDLGAKRHFILAMFPSLPEKAVRKLAAGDYTVDGESVVVVA